MAIITVIGIEPNRICLWQRDPAHPGGEAYVAYGMVVQVADTPEVLERINNGLLGITAAATTPPWTGYDALDAATVIAHIALLGDVERIVTRQYEAANQNRSTVLDALTQGIIE